MFGGAKRRGQANPPQTSASVNPSAATAAASAFMSAAKHNPNKSLSSAAAAAALRARPQTPTNVGDVQTKRTARRSASVSSSGSGPSGPSGLNRRTSRLERRGSSGSMTERTFRTPSPHRSSPPQPARDEPPVPRIPEGHKKSASSSAIPVGMQTFRTASQRKGSDFPSWYTQPHGDTSNVRTADAAFAKSTAPKQESGSSMPPRTDSRASSRNYSYPSTFRPQSPPASPTSAHIPPANNLPAPRTPASPPRSSKASITSSTSGRPEPQMVYDPNSRRMVPVPVAEIEYQIRETAEKQPRKKRNSGVQRSGSHLAKGTVARARGSIFEDREKGHVEPGEAQRTVEAAPVKEQSPIVRDAPAKSTDIDRLEARQSKNRDASQSPEPGPSRLKSPPPRPQPTAYEPPTAPQPSKTASGKLPVAQEESEEDEDSGPETKTTLSEKVLNALDSVPTRQKVFEQPRTVPTPIPEEGDMALERQPEPVQASEIEQAEPEPRRESALYDKKRALEPPRAVSNPSRSNSNSPARQTRFASSPLASLAIRHNPLPRSASPIKPALKQTGARETSPSDGSSENAANHDASPNPPEEPPIQRKKSVRVSFDDQNTRVVGESAQSEDLDSSAPPSPQQTAKRPWYSNIGRGKRREVSLDDDEIMKPRPALPSFGSVREKKARQLEERPLVQPYKAARPPSEASSPAIQPNQSNTPVDTNEIQAPSLTQSNDHAIGAVLSQEQASRNPPNISRFREPLPPVVTSAEGLEDMSDTTLDSDHDLASSILESDIEAAPSTQPTQDTQFEAQESSRNGTAVLEGKTATSEEEPPPPHEIPEISIIQPSPRLPRQNSIAENMNSPDGQYFDVPGGFPEDTGADTNQPLEARTDVDTSHHAPSQAAGAIFEPTADIQHAQPDTLPQTTLVATPQSPVTEGSEDDTDDNSIYSDAYEDLSDIEEAGFQSLDAVVESPTTNVTSQTRDKSEAPVQGTTAEPGTPSPTFRSGIDGQPADPRTVDGWEQAKFYWRSLTADKRQQLEREALEDAGMDGDREEVAVPVRRQSSRRKAVDPKQRVGESKLRETPKSEPSKPAKPAQPNSETKHETSSPAAATRMRSSLREQPAKGSQTQATSMRKSMRAGTDRQSGERATPRATLSKQERQVPKTTNATTNAASVNAAGSALSRKSEPSLQRRGSDASESSFKRARPSTREGLSFKKTMRQSEPAGGSSRFSLRSLSPNGSLRRNSVMSTGSVPPGNMMRRTLRSGSESSHEGKGSAHFPTFGRSSKAAVSSKAKKSSRFGDDSDGEDEPRRFQSRFDDSSDEEVEPAPLEGNMLAKGTLRGSATVPTSFKRTPTVPEAVQESPELPDSDDNMSATMRSQHHAAARAALGRSTSGSIGTATLTRSRSGRGGFNTTLPSTTAPPKEKRGSLISILRRNKKVDHGGKIQRADPTESAARRDTRLERNADQLKDIRSDSRPSSPKLQKRSNTLKRGESWPLAEEEMQRPRTSGNGLRSGSLSGLGTEQRPNFVGRRSTSLGLTGAQDDDELSGRNVITTGDSHKKKKKFGALRRMLRLDD